MVRGLWTQIPIRLRLTLWYVLLMGVTFTILAFFLFARFQRSLLNTLDTSLQIAVTQTLSSFELDEDLSENQRLTFENTLGQISGAGFAMRLVSSEGETWDTYGAFPEFTDLPFAVGYRSVSDSVDEAWRVFTQSIIDEAGTVVGWLRVAQSLDGVSETLEDFRIQLFWGIPLILLFAGLGGYFLANRALRPIEQITTTTRQITASDLSRRLEYQGPVDEIGRLAHTFDQMLQRLEDAFRRERRLTSDAAHELRTPLTVLKGQIEVTLSRSRESVEYRQKLEELGLQVDRLIRLSNALLFLSRSDQNQLSWEPIKLNLAEILEVIIEQIRPLAEKKRLGIRVDLPQHLSVTGDTDHLTRLFLNLMDNAVKYSPRSGQIKIDAGNGAASSEIVIYNSGPGIPTEHLPHLFERFYRVDEDRSTQTGGTGLGLAIAGEIVRLHKGEIKIESTPDVGVKVEVNLPN